MTNEALISRLFETISEITRLGGEEERTAIVPNILVADDSPSDLPSGYIKIVNPRDGTYVPCLVVAGLTVATNDLVNVLFTKGTEPVALTQGSGSSGANNYWTRVGTELSQFFDGDTVALYDTTPTKRFGFDPGTPATASNFTMSDTSGLDRIEFSGGTALAVSSFVMYDATGVARFYMDSSSLFFARDSAGIARIDWSPGTPATDTVITLTDQATDDKLQLLSSSSYRILFTDNSTDVDINMYGVDVTGNPLYFWDESEDSFSQNKGLIITSGDLLIPDDLVHALDPDTLWSFTDDQITIQAGGIILFQLTEGVQDVVDIGDVSGGGDVDIDINNGQATLTGSDGLFDVDTGIETAVYDFEVLDTANDSGITSHWRDNDSSYPAGWTETDAAWTTNTNDPYSFWSIISHPTDTSFDYRIQGSWDLENDSAANAFNSWILGPMTFRPDDAWSGDTDFYFGTYADNAGSIDTATFVRAHLQFSNSAGVWRIRGEDMDGMTETDGSWFTIPFPYTQPIYLRCVIRNDANAGGRIYIGTGFLSGDPLAQYRIQAHNVGAAVTFGTAWARIHGSQPANGANATWKMGALDFISSTTIG